MTLKRRYIVRLNDESFGHGFGTHRDYSWDLVEWPKDMPRSTAERHISSMLGRHTLKDIPWQVDEESLNDEGIYLEGTV